MDTGHSNLIKLSLLKRLEQETSKNEFEFVALSTDEVADYFLKGDEGALDSLDDALDNAQDRIHTGEKQVAYILIKVE